MTQPRVGVVMGSDSDWPTMQETVATLKEFGIAHEVSVISAHRSPGRARTYAAEAAGRGVQVIIAGAGSAAHLAGAIAAHTCLPVIGVPMESRLLGGLDALLSTVQMPGGVPVATVALGKAGARNAGILAAQILALGDPSLRRKIAQYKDHLAARVEEKSRMVAEKAKAE